MAGIGKYKKGAKFTLKSGNSPMFKTIGSSPIMHYVDDVPDHNDGHSDDLQTPEEHEEAKSPVKQTKDKKKNTIGEGFMNPPYKDTASGTKPYAKRQGYHGYKNFDSILEKQEDAQGKDTNIKTPKVFKDGKSKRIHFHKKSKK